MKQYQITLIGCDDRTQIIQELTDEEYHRLKHVAMMLNTAATYECQPTMVVEEYDILKILGERIEGALNYITEGAEDTETIARRLARNGYRGRIRSSKYCVVAQYLRAMVPEVKDDSCFALVGPNSVELMVDNVGQKSIPITDLLQAFIRDFDHRRFGYLIDKEEV